MSVDDGKSAASERCFGCETERWRMARHATLVVWVYNQLSNNSNQAIYLSIARKRGIIQLFFLSSWALSCIHVPSCAANPESIAIYSNHSSSLRLPSPRFYVRPAMPSCQDAMNVILRTGFSSHSEYGHSEKTLHFMVRFGDFFLHAVVSGHDEDDDDVCKMHLWLFRESGQDGWLATRVWWRAAHIIRVWIWADFFFFTPCVRSAGLFQWKIDDVQYMQ